RDSSVTGVQTCALPISGPRRESALHTVHPNTPIASSQNKNSKRPQPQKLIWKIRVGINFLHIVMVLQGIDQFADCRNFRLAFQRHGNTWKFGYFGYGGFDAFGL